MRRLTDSIVTTWQAHNKIIFCYILATRTQSNLATGDIGSYRYLLSCHIMSCPHLIGFDRTGSNAIRSADQENPILERKWSGSDEPLPWYDHSNGGWIWDSNLGEEGEVVEGQRSYSKEHCDHCAISDHLAVICRRMPATLKSTWGGSVLFGSKF